MTVSMTQLTPRLLFSLLLSASSLSLVSLASAAPITPGNFVLLRVGDGATTLTTASAAVFLEEYTPTGSPVQTIAVPTTTVGSNRRLTIAGSSTAEGGLSISPDGRYITFTGYDAAPATASIATSTTVANNRIVGVLDTVTGTLDTSTVYTTAFSGQSIRGATTDGTNIWAVGGTGGVQTTTIGAVGTATQLSTAPTNLRRIEIFNGQLYIGTGAAGFQGVSAVGTGTPTATGQTTTLLSGFTGTQSTYDFWFANPTTLYVADDRAVGSGGGIQKWTQSAGVWSLAYTLSTGTGATSVRGLTGAFVGGTATLYATSTQAGSNNNFVFVTDTGASSAYNVLATSGTNRLFRGIERASAPEPGTIALLGIGVLLLRRRRSQRAAA
jgi:hypothetical protein